MDGVIVCRPWSCWWRSVWAAVDPTWVLGMPCAASLNASPLALFCLVSSFVFHGLFSMVGVGGGGAEWSPKRWQYSWRERVTSIVGSWIWRMRHLCVQDKLEFGHLLSARAVVWCRWSWTVWSVWEGAHWRSGLTDQSDERGPHRLCTGKRLPVIMCITSFIFIILLPHLCLIGGRSCLDFCDYVSYYLSWLQCSFVLMFTGCWKQDVHCDVSFALCLHYVRKD